MAHSVREGEGDGYNSFHIQSSIKIITADDNYRMLIRLILAFLSTIIVLLLCVYVGLMVYPECSFFSSQIVKYYFLKSQRGVLVPETAVYK